VIGLAAGVVLIALAGGVALFAFGSGRNDANDTGTGSSSNLVIDRNPLIFRAPLDGGATGFADHVGRPPTNASVTGMPGALEFTAGKGGDAGRELALKSGVVDYILAVDFTVTPGSRAKIDIGVRWTPDSKVGELLRIDTVEAHATFARFERGATPAQSRILAVGDTVRLPGLTSGRAQHLAVVVRGRTLQLYRDGEQVISTADPKMPTSPTVPGIDVLGVPDRGTMRLTGLQLRTAPPA
jgi:hypothetical protein